MGAIKISITMAGSTTSLECEHLAAILEDDEGYHIITDNSITTERIAAEVFTSLISNKEVVK